MTITTIVAREVHDRDNLAYAITRALDTGNTGSLWLHLVTLCQRIRSAFRPSWDGLHVYIGHLRLTPHSRGWFVARQASQGTYHKLKTPAHGVLVEMLGGVN